jgi:hypothetical protein
MSVAIVLTENRSYTAIEPLNACLRNDLNLAARLCSHVLRKPTS